MCKGSEMAQRHKITSEQQQNLNPSKPWKKNMKIKYT
jgi:hypothetical protein